jgi:hypothetical protein
VVADRGDLAVPEDLLEMVTVQFQTWTRTSAPSWRRPAWPA